MSTSTGEGPRSPTRTANGGKVDLDSATHAYLWMKRVDPETGVALIPDGKEYGGPLNLWRDKFEPIAVKAAISALKADFGYRAVGGALLTVDQHQNQDPVGEKGIRNIMRSAQAALAPQAPAISAADALRNEARRLAALPSAERAVGMDAAAKKLDVKKSVLAEQVREAQKEATAKTPVASGFAEAFPVVDPWHEPVNTSDLLDEINALFRRFVVLSKSGLDFLTLYIPHTYLFEAREYTPLPHISSPSPGCGKTKLLEVICGMARNAVMAAHMSPASLYRLTAGGPVFIAHDEIDSRVNIEEIRNFFNSGNHRNGAVLRTTDKGEGVYVVERFPTYSAKITAGIGGTHATMASRGPEIRLEKRTLDQPIERLGRHDFSATKQKLVRWREDHYAAVEAFQMEPPEWLGDRPFDFLEPIFAIASLAGPEWMERALSAARDLCGTRDDEPARTMDVGVELLMNVRDAFGEKDDALASRDLLHRLCDCETWKWAEYNRGQREKELSKSQLAQMLRPFGISPNLIRFSDGQVLRGYRRKQFVEVWERYFPVASQETVTGVTGVTDKPEAGSLSSEINGVTDVTPPSLSVTPGVAVDPTTGVTWSIFD